MRRIAALALVGGAAFVGWRYWRAGGFGGAPSAGASLEVLEQYQPTELRAEFDNEAAADAVQQMVASGWTLGDPHAGADVLAQIPDADIAARVAALADAGRAHLRSGIRTTSSSTTADRAVIAEAECKRASHVAGLPVWLIDDCARALATKRSWAHLPPGTRWQIAVDIGPWGIPGYEAPAPSRL